ncbi:hypothetical protein NKI98_26935 [Mesorhizobium sp. M0222]|uniref:hypothetical protein n=1 Tax=Mesorhizobium sp. M0222 TaxID=2956921 RepID=UPI0033353E3C
MPNPLRTGFGSLASVDPLRLFKLPLPMQAEGVRLLFEMGQTSEQVRQRLGLSVQQVRALVTDESVFSRGGEAIAEADEAW